MGGYVGDGTFQFTYNWQNDAANGIPITASRMDGQFQDAVSGFDLVICRDGQSTTSAQIPFAAGLSTAAGIQFPATQVPSANVNNLDDYEEGTWTPADGSGAGLSYTVSNSGYIKVGRIVIIQATITFPVNVSSGAIAISGAPFAVTSGAFASGATNTDAGITFIARLDPSTGNISLLTNANTAVQNSSLSGKLLNFTITYFATA